MDRKISHLQPNSVWSYFEDICQVPRPSKREGKIIAFLEGFAEKNNLTFKKDSVGNVLISKLATVGFEKRKTVILQSHLDMVCEKNSNVIHDFDIDPIKPHIEGDWVTSGETTLGADCGIGIAAQMAVLTSTSIKHGPIECLFTVDEETGLTGAFALEPDFMTGKILLNLDSEDEGQLFIGCAGGIDTVISFNYSREEVPAGYFPLEINISGLMGGHSGDDINKGRGNANKILVRFLYHVMQKFDLRLASISGGNLRNAIAREANAVIMVPNAKKENVVADFNIFKHDLINEFAPVEKELKLELGSADFPEFVVDNDTSRKLILSLYACPHGVHAMSFRMPGLVETSTNLASIRMKENTTIEVTTSQRSDQNSGKDDIASMVEAVFKLAGANEVVHSDGYPGWAPNPDSEILKTTVGAYQKLFGNKPLVRSIHAGLECGLFLEKYPGLDMVSFGPTIMGAHSPVERINIETVQKFWDLLVEVLENIPAEN